MGDENTVMKRTLQTYFNQLFRAYRGVNRIMKNEEIKSRKNKLVQLRIHWLFIAILLGIHSYGQKTNLDEVILTFIKQNEVQEKIKQFANKDTLVILMDSITDSKVLISVKSLDSIPIKIVYKPQDVYGNSSKKLGSNMILTIRVEFIPDKSEIKLLLLGYEIDPRKIKKGIYPAMLFDTKESSLNAEPERKRN